MSMHHRSASWTAGSKVGAQGGGSAGVPSGAKTGWYATQSLPWGTRGFGVCTLPTGKKATQTVQVYNVKTTGKFDL